MLLRGGVHGAAWLGARVHALSWLLNTAHLACNHAVTELQIVLAMAGKFGCSSAWALGITYGKRPPLLLQAAL